MLIFRTHGGQGRKRGGVKGIQIAGTAGDVVHTKAWPFLKSSSGETSTTLSSYTKQGESAAALAHGYLAIPNYKLHPKTESVVLAIFYVNLI